MMKRMINPFRLKKIWLQLLFGSWIAGILVTLFLFGFPTGQASAQQPTGSIPTVTGTPLGPQIMVYRNNPIIGVYSGPSSYNYQQIGILMALEKAPALGYSADKNWIEIVYQGVPDGKGWIYGPLVSLSPGSLPVLLSPPTATPQTTATLNPTYVAAFGVQLAPTRLPTFTAPAPIKIPTFAADTGSVSKIPFGFVILGLALIGILGAIISFLRGSR
jgi:hypothetical protein